ncbi:MAG: HigA family addiction module antitoxin [Akkermansiaceae bacterium]
MKPNQAPTSLREPKQIPNPPSNPVTGLIRGNLAHHGLTQAAAAKAMRISPGVICDVIKDRKPVSTELALRLEHCLGLSADFILKVQAHFQYCVEYHAKSSIIAAEVKILVTA